MSYRPLLTFKVNVPYKNALDSKQILKNLAINPVINPIKVTSKMNTNGYFPITSPIKTK